MNPDPVPFIPIGNQQADPASGLWHQISQIEGRAEKGQIKKKEKLQFQMKELMEQEEKAQYELGASMIYVLAAIPQRIEMDPLAQIAAGFRPIGGRMKGG